MKIEDLPAANIYMVLLSRSNTAKLYLS